MGFAFADFELDSAMYELRRQGQQVALEPQAFDVLLYLVANRDHVVSKEELMDEIWGGRFVSESAVTSRIKQCRRAVGDDGQSQSMIKTLHGRGYRFVAPVVETEASTPSSTSPSRRDEPVKEASRTPKISAQVTDDADLPSGPPLVGREHEQGVLRAVFSRALSERGQLVLVTGEPGIGKSALVQDFLGYAESRGAVALQGRAVPTGGPYRPIAEALTGVWRSGGTTDVDALRPFRHALSRVLPGTPEPDAEGMDAGLDPVVLLGEGLLQLLLTLEAAVAVLVVEDAHDADTDTLAVLDYLATAVTGQRVMIIVTRRDWPQPAALVGLSSTQQVRQVRLSRLDDAVVATLVDSLRRLPEEARAAVVRRSEGLPVVAAELTTATGGPDGTSGWFVPQSISALVDARLVALTEAEQRLLAAASVLGTSPDWELVPEVAGVGQAAAVAGLRRAVTLHLLVVDGAGLRWRHGLVRSAVWARLLPLERRAYGRAAAVRLLSQGTEDADLKAAELLFAVGEVEQAVECWLRLCRSAAARGALLTADELLHRVELTGHQPTAAAIRRVELLTFDGQAAKALEVGAVSLPSARGEEHADLCLLMARAAIAAGRYARAAELVGRAGREDEPRSLILLSDAAHGAGRMQEAARLAAKAVTAARPDGPPELLCEALCAEARVARLHSLDHAASCFATAARIAAEHGLGPWAVEANFGLGTLELLREESSRTLADVQQRAVDLGLLGRAAQAEVLLADHFVAHDGPTADPAPAARIAEYGRLLRAPFLSFTAGIVEATRSAFAGDLRAMERRLSALESGPELPPDSRAQFPAVRALAALVHSDLDLAADLLDAALRPLASHGSAAPLIQFGAWALVSMLVRGEADDARSVLLAQTAGQRRANQGALRYSEAVAAGRRGEPDAAQAAFGEGDALLAPLPWWHRLLRLLTLTAAVRDGWGDPVPQLRMDLDAFERAADEHLARRCRDLLRLAGAATRQGRGDAVVPSPLRAAGVTSREMDVLQLVEQGLTNADISSRLFLSTRTVETHVANLLAKSGAANRQELRSWCGAMLGGRRLTP